MKTLFAISGWRVDKFFHSKLTDEKINSQISTARRTGRGKFQWDLTVVAWRIAQVCLTSISTTNNHWNLW
ncbi:hypothetical protein [Bdellovibrio sp. NC01]|uniref:hypothetical protein n=1 Tax=Bdellovibrio sp. NC01 TaxID=2220073 RepID=UPI00115AAE60|nr:hypothetical protein [Bdellovibrio sp. NC01]